MRAHWTPEVHLRAHTGCLLFPALPQIRGESPSSAPRPLYLIIFEEVDDGGYGNSRIIIELGPFDGSSKLIGD